jgi:hypothetical protein
MHTQNPGSQCWKTRSATRFDMDFQELTGLLSATVTTRLRKTVDLAVPVGQRYLVV